MRYGRPKFNFSCLNLNPNPCLIGHLHTLKTARPFTFLYRGPGMFNSWHCQCCVSILGLRLKNLHRKSFVLKFKIKVI